MKWFKILTNIPTILKLLKETREAFDMVKEKVNDPEVQKEIDDVYKVLAEFS